MKILSRIRDYTEHCIDILAMAVFLLLLLVGIYAIIDIHNVNMGALTDEEMAKLAPEEDIDIEALRKINPEIVGWIRIRDTKIDYPVLQAEDNNKYLVRNYRGDYETAGAIFVDYRNDKFNDDFTIIYGHRMSGNLMFGEIPRFGKRTYFNEHPSGVLYTEDAIYDLEISDYSVMDINETTIFAHDLNRNNHNDKVIEDIRGSAEQSRKVNIEKGDKILVLSTCDKDSKHYRDVLLTKMVKR